MRHLGRDIVRRTKLETAGVLKCFARNRQLDSQAPGKTRSFNDRRRTNDFLNGPHCPASLNHGAMVIIRRPKQIRKTAVREQQGFEYSVTLRLLGCSFEAAYFSATQ